MNSVTKEPLYLVLCSSILRLNCWLSFLTLFNHFPNKENDSRTHLNMYINDDNGQRQFISNLMIMIRVQCAHISDQNVENACPILQQLLFIVTTVLLITILLTDKYQCKF